jgi:DNA-binding transcriptional LysR family regulator
VGQVCNNLFANVDSKPRILARVHTHHLAGRLVQRGLGFAILDAVTVRALLHDRTADAISVRRIDGDPVIPVTAIHGSRRGLSNPVKLFIDCFEKSCADLNDSLRELLP